MKLIEEAYEILMNEETREIYDNFGFQGLQEILEQSTNQQQNNHSGKHKGQAIGVKLEVTLEEFYCGAKKDLPIKRQRRCKVCKGTGSSKPEDSKDCEKCGGQGIVMGLQQVGGGYVQQVRQYCPDCYGKGKIIKDELKCKTCTGTSYVAEDKILKVKIGKGMQHGQQLKFDSEGDESDQFSPGDIYVILEQKPHQRFERQGNNLIMAKKISLSESLKGLQFKMEHLDKKILVIKSRKGEIIKTDSLQLLANEGMPLLNSKKDKGDLIIQFDVEFPKKALPKEIMEKLFEI